MNDLNDHSSRAHALLSASSAHRWGVCPASARLSELYPAQDTVFTREGTLAHEVAEAMARDQLLHEVGPVWAEMNEIPEEMIGHAKAYADYLSQICDDHTVVMLEQRVDFSPWVPEGFGTADAILLHGNTMDVVDFKYGQGVEVSAQMNPQMLLYGLGALNEYGFVYDVKNIRLHIFQPRKDNISVYKTIPEELFKFGEKMKKTAEIALGSDPPMSAGDHCKFCPHAGHCPELAKTCLEAVTIGGSIAPETVKGLAPEAVAKILQLEPMISAFLKKLREQALTDAMNGEEIPGFKIVEGKLGNRKWTDEIAVAKILDEAGIPLDTYTTLELLSPAAMDKALGKKRAKELLENMIDRAPGSPTLVPLSDKRPKLDRVAQAADDFKD